MKNIGANIRDNILVNILVNIRDNIGTQHPGQPWVHIIKNGRNKAAALGA